MSKKIRILLGTVTVLITALLGYTISARLESRDLRVSILDVGQGDAIVIRTPYEQNILIDGGPNGSVIERLGEELPFYDRDIDLMILTHPHADHVNGLVDVLQRYAVKRVLYTGAVHTSGKYLEFLKLIRDQSIPLELVEGPREVLLGDDLALDLLYPLHSFRDQQVQELNDTSIVGKLTYKESSFLFTGDAEAPVEKELLATDAAQLNSDVLKVGHHGSDSSTTDAFLDAVSPEFAVISAGQGNRYGHPHESTLKKLFARSINVFRTDRDGTVTFTSNGKEITPHLEW